MTRRCIEFGKITGLKDKFDMPIGQIDSLQDWHHIVFTTSFEELTKTGARIYVDGKLESDMTGGASEGRPSYSRNFMSVAPTRSTPSAARWSSTSW